MNDPTRRRAGEGRTRPTTKPPRSRGRASMMVATSGVAGDREHAGSRVGQTLMELLAPEISGGDVALLDAGLAVGSHERAIDEVLGEEPHLHLASTTQGVQIGLGGAGVDMKIDK